jgi:hypothetical protein
VSAVRFLAVVKTTVPPVPLWLEVDATILDKVEVNNVQYHYTFGQTERLLQKSLTRHCVQKP